MYYSNDIKPEEPTQVHKEEPITLEEPKKNNIGTIIIVIIIILILLVGGFFVYNYFKNKNINSPEDNTLPEVDDNNKLKEDLNLETPVLQPDTNTTTPNTTGGTGTIGGDGGDSEGGADGGGGGTGDTGETEDDEEIPDENIEIELPVSDWTWLNKLGGSNYETAKDFIMDNSGNIYLIGSYYENSVIGSTTLNGSGYHDVFVAKIDPNGNVLWVTKASGVRYDLGQAIDIDSSGNIYVAGIFNSPTINFDNSSLSLTLSGTPSDIFIAKMDNSGNWLWAKKAGGTDLDNVSDIVVDSSSNIYITGFIRLDATFPPLAPISGEAIDDLFVAKMNSSGDFLWVKRASGANIEYGSSIVLDSENNIYISGNYSSSNLILGNITLNNTSEEETNQYNSFIAKLDNSGNWLWAKQTTGIHTELINDLVIDGSNNLYATGYFAGTSSFDTHTISSYGCTNDISPYPEECEQNDIFITKMDNSGNWLWVKSAGGEADSEHGNGLTVDNQLNLYVTGKFSGTAYFGGSFLTSAQAATSDIFIAKLNSSTGSFISAEKFGGNGDDEGISVLLGPDLKEYYLGNFTETSEFGNTQLTSTGQTDIYLGKKI